MPVCTRMSGHGGGVLRSRARAVRKTLYRREYLS